MEHIEQVPGSSEVICGCRGLIQRPASSGSYIASVLPKGTSIVAVAKSPIRRNPSGFGITTRTPTVRVLGSTIGSIKATRPSKYWPGSDCNSVFTRTP